MNQDLDMPSLGRIQGGEPGAMPPPPWSSERGARGGAQFSRIIVKIHKITPKVVFIYI